MIEWFKRRSRRKATERTILILRNITGVPLERMSVEETEGRERTFKFSVTLESEHHADILAGVVRANLLETPLISWLDGQWTVSWKSTPGAIIKIYNRRKK